MALCGYKGCNRVAGHGTPGSLDNRVRHRYASPKVNPKVEKPPKEEPNPCPFNPPKTPSVIWDKTLTRNGKRYKHGDPIRLKGTSQVFTFLYEIWDTDNPGHEWVQVKNEKGFMLFHFLDRVDP
jgi:hypothetical protein